jgi:hypothetical protein
VRTNGVAGPLSERRFVESARVAVVVNCTIMRKSVWYGIVDATDVNTFYFGAADPLEYVRDATENEHAGRFPD